MNKSRSVVQCINFIKRQQLTPDSAGSAPSARLDFTRIGTQSLVFHAPVVAEPETWPTLSDIVFIPLSAALESIYHIYVSARPKYNVLEDQPAQSHISTLSIHSHSQLRGPR